MVQSFDPEEVQTIVEKMSEMLVEPTRSLNCYMCEAQFSIPAAKSPGEQVKCSGCNATNKVPQHDSSDSLAAALKSVLGSISDSLGKQVAGTIISLCIKGLAYSEDEHKQSLQLDCMDVCKTLLSRFGPDVSARHKELLSVLKAFLEHPDEVVRKGGITSIGPLVVWLDGDMFKEVMELVIQKIEESKNKEVYIQTVSVLCKAAGVRVSEYLQKIVPQLFKFCFTEDESKEDSAKEELWENCLQALEAIVFRCPNKVGPFVGELISLARGMMK